MNKTLLLTTIVSVLAMLEPSWAGHPLLQNGWLKGATDNSVSIDIPKGGEMTFQLSEKTRIVFNGVEGVPGDIKTVVSQMGTKKIIVNIRRDAPESMNAVLVGLRVDKPSATAPTRDPAAPANESSSSQEASGASEQTGPAE